MNESNGEGKDKADGQDRDRWIVVIGAFVLFGVVLAYTIAFGVVSSLPFGGPGTWGEVGDYVGGLVNPVVGLATVVLVVRTLRVMRMEAADTRWELSKQTGHLEAQVRHFERRETFEEIRKRLDGALSDWNLALEAPLPGISRVNISFDFYPWQTRGVSIRCFYTGLTFLTSFG